MQNKASETVYAGFFVRLAAFIVDSLIVGTGLLFIKLPIWFAAFGTDNILSRDFIFQYSALDIIYYLLKLCYFVLLTYFTGATLGKKLFHLRVVSSEDRTPSFFEIAFRESVGRFLSALVLYVGYIMVGADKKKRGLHDMLSDTYVVYEHKVSVAVPTPVLVQNIPYTVQPGQNQFMQNSAQNQFASGNAAQNPIQNQFVPGNAVQNPIQNQPVPKNAAQNPAPQQTQNGNVQENMAQNQEPQ